MHEAQRIDAKGLKCPMPVIKLQQQVRQTASGQRLIIECTDPGAKKDIQSWCKVNKHPFIRVTPTDYGYDIEVEVG